MKPQEFIDSLRGMERAQAEDMLEDEIAEIGALFRAEQAANFAKAESESGIPWPPRVGNPPHPPLIKSGRMYRAATTLGAIGNVHEQRGRVLILGIRGSGVPYANDHQKGRPGKRLPRRQFIYFREDRRRSIPGILGRGLRRIIKKTIG